MKRYSKDFLKKHPHLRGKDIETTRKKCRKFKDYPVTVASFVEGTRFNFQKHKKQNSPYQHLLLPKAGGVATIISSMGEYLSKVLDVTVIYPKNRPPIKFSSLLKNQVPLIKIKARLLDIPSSIIGKDYLEDANIRKEFQHWLNQIWQEKDLLIQQQT